MLKESLTQITCYYIKRKNYFPAIFETITPEEAIIPARYFADIWWRYFTVRIQVFLGVML